MIHDLSDEKPQYRVQGHVFTLLPTTPVNERRVQKAYDDYLAWMQDFHRRQGEYELEVARFHAGDRDDAPTITEYVDQEKDSEREGRLYFDLFCYATEGPHDQIAYEDFDKKIAEVVIKHFFPQQRVTALVRNGFLAP